MCSLTKNLVLSRLGAAVSRRHLVSGCTDLRPPLNITVICSFESTTFAEQKCCSKKKDTPTGVFLFGAGDETRWRPCRAATRTRAPKHATGMFFSLRSCPFEPLPDLTKKKHHPDGWCFFLLCVDKKDATFPVVRKERDVCRGNLSRVSPAF